MKRKFAVLSALILALSFTVTGCSNNGIKAGSEATTQSVSSSDGTGKETTDGTGEETTQRPLTDEEKELYKPVTKDLVQLQQPQAGETVATIHTNKGDIMVRFFPEYAPKAVENFVTHARDGYYNGQIFHRVINNFMIQGGDPTGTGTGGESIWGEDFETEVTFNLRHFRGALCMAKTSEPVSIGSQFYIVQNPDIGDDLKSQFEQLRTMKDEVCFEHPDVGQLTYGDLYPDAVLDEYINNGGYPSLDMNYTVFGQVYAGMDVVDSIAATKTDANDKPLEDMVIESIEVSEY